MNDHTFILTARKATVVGGISKSYNTYRYHSETRSVLRCVTLRSGTHAFASDSSEDETFDKILDCEPPYDQTDMTPEGREFVEVRR